MKGTYPLKKKLLRRFTLFSNRLQNKIFRIFARLRIDRIIAENFLRALPLWFASALAGGIAVLYATLFARAETVGASIVSQRPWLLFILTPISFICAGYVVQRFAPLARGSGIPQITAALEISGAGNPTGIERLLGLRVAIVKVISSCVLVLGGGAIGREGPTIQISGAVFRFVGRILPARWPAYSEKIMILTGSAAGLAAAFNTPLGGIVFAIEELSRLHFNSFRTTLLTAVIIAGFSAQMLLGPYLYLGYPNVSGTVLTLVGFVVMTALVCGALGGIFSQFILGLIMVIRQMQTVRQRLLIAGFLGLLLATIAFSVSPVILGSGKDSVLRLLFRDEEIGISLGILRFFGPIISFVAGGAGGIFAPALATGASLGALMANSIGLPLEQANVIILTGMVGFLTGVTRSPFTSAILVLEMTDRHSVIFFLMLAGLVSLLAAWIIDKVPLYESLKNIYVNEVLFRPRAVL